MKIAYSSDTWNWILHQLMKANPKPPPLALAVQPREAELHSPPQSDSVDNQELVLDFR